MRAQIDSNAARISELEEQNKLLRDGVKELKRLQESELLERRRATARLCEADIIISGASCPAESSLTVVFKKVTSALGVNLSDEDILSCRYLITRSQARKKDYPLPIIVKLCSRELALKVLSASKSKGTLLSSDIGFTSTSSSSAIHIKEALPSDLYRLLLATKSVAKSLGYKYVWQRDGIVLLRKVDGASITRIRSASDLEALKAQTSPSSADDNESRPGSLLSTHRLDPSLGSC
ncbi:hypothetical protein KPH14_012779 [Odynerus spinipes]|uniref:FP protein C-terminal domain-containing protein n=1 Tax=Odynerus spinipes TaxID=1348599 RepID=A0AAD9RDE5_9HYME|nr:hypothetical protein KPH14_012779 [Odynerus spinipes]